MPTRLRSVIRAHNRACTRRCRWSPRMARVETGPATGPRTRLSTSAADATPGAAYDQRGPTMPIRIGIGPHRARQIATGRLLPGDPAALLRGPAGGDSPVLRVMLERRAERNPLPGGCSPGRHQAVEAPPTAAHRR